MSKLNVLIAGSTGYIGVQLVKLLAKHQNINIKYLCGNNSVGIWYEAKGVNVLSAGNLLANPEVSRAIVEKFENASGHLGERLITSLQGGLEAGEKLAPFILRV